VSNRLESVDVVNAQQMLGLTDSILIERLYAEQLPMLSHSVGELVADFALFAPAISLKLDTIVMAGGAR
jgi:hypothetical protein